MTELGHEGFPQDVGLGYSEAAMGFPSGLSIWALGQFPKKGESSEYYEGGKKSGPYRGLSKMPPSISMHREGERDPGSRGRLVVRHQFLDVARYRIRPFRKKKKIAPVCWDRLRDFRGLVWYLVLAGYSPSYIRTFFLTELPNVFPSLSYWGVRFSVEKAYERAFAGELLLDDEFLDALQDFKAGPWAHNAPDWLRAQYGVPLAEPESKGKDSRKGKEKDPGKNVAGDSAAEPVVAKVAGDLEREGSFWAMWKNYKAACPGAPDPTSEEVVLGMNQGISAILARREAAGGLGSPGAAVPVVGVVPISPVESSPVGFPGSVPLGIPAGVPGVSGMTAEQKKAKFLEEVALVEAIQGFPLNLSNAEYLEAYSMGLAVYLKTRDVPPVPAVSAAPLVSLDSPAAGSSGVRVPELGPEVGKDVVGGVSGEEKVVEPVVTPVVEPAVEPAIMVVPAAEPAVEPSGESLVSGDPVEVVSPEVSPEVSQEADPVVEPKVAEVPAEVPEVPVEVVAAVEPSAEKPVVVEPAWWDPIPDSELLKVTGLGTAMGIRGGPDVDYLNTGKAPHVWKMDFTNSLNAGVEPSDFYKSLGDAAPFLVDSLIAKDYGDWVITGDHFLGIFSDFCGSSPKKKMDVTSRYFPTMFPKLEAAPKMRGANYADGFYNLRLDQAKACYAEWDRREREETPESLVRPDPMLMDLVERGLGPAFWGAHEGFLINWIIGTAVRQAFGFPNTWIHHSGRRYIVLAAIPSVKVLADLPTYDLRFNGAPWRPTSQMHVEAFAPRNEMENLPGHVWATGYGYIPVSAYEKLHAYVGPGSEKHPDFVGVDRDVMLAMQGWVGDVIARVKTRAYRHLSKYPALGHHFITNWIPEYSNFCSRPLGGRMISSPLLCLTGLLVNPGFDEMFTSKTILVPEPGMMSAWEVFDGAKHLVADLQKIPFSLHLPSLYATTAYYQFVEDRRPLFRGKPYRGVKFPDSMLVSEDQVQFPTEKVFSNFRTFYKARKEREKRPL